MTSAEAMHAHLADLHAAAVRTLDYVRRHARAAAREHTAAPSPESHAALANASVSVKSAETALAQAVARLDKGGPTT